MDNHWSASLLWLCAMVCSVLRAEAIPCNSTAAFTTYILDPEPAGGTPGGCFSSSGRIICSTGALLDEYTWTRNQSDSIVVGFQIPETHVQRANVYFHNQPSQGIGLPSVEYLWGNWPNFASAIPLESTILGNEDLRQTDSDLRDISLVVTGDLSDVPEYTYFSIRFTFSNSSPIHTLVLSEVELCTDEVTIPVNPITFEEGNTTLVLGPDSVTTSLELSCTVTNEGRFDITWTLPPAATDYQTMNLDGTRTSILQVSRLTSSHSGNYVCQPSYPALPLDVTPPPNSVRIISVDLEGDLEPLERSVMGTVNMSVSLSCELYGYMSGAVEITWEYENERQLVSDSVYTITEENGDRLIQNGGDSPIPGVRSILTIDMPTINQTGTYICQAGVLNGIISLDIEPSEPSPSMPAPTSTSTPTLMPSNGGGGSSSGGVGDAIIIAGAVVGGLLILIILTVVVIVVLCVLKRRRSAHMDFYDSKEDMASDPFYAEVQKPSPPPLPARGYPGAYAQIDTTSGSNQIELVAMNHSRASVSSVPLSDNPTLAKLKQNPTFMQGTWERNPKYMSLDGLDLSDGGPSNHRRLRGGSVPALDIVPSPDQSLLNIYAQPMQVVRPVRHSLSPPPATACPLYSEALTPMLFRQQQQESQGGSPPPDADAELHPYASIYADPRPLRRSEGPLIVTHQNVEEIRNLGIGQFGHVVLAKTINLSLKQLKLSETNDDTSIGVLVAMKKLKPNAEPLVKEAFEKEIKFMSRLHHENVVSLLAICSTDSPFILMEYMENGDLNLYLRNHELALPSDDPPAENQLKFSTLLRMCVQISSGMRYLASLKFIHRDLATRNCLVGDNVVKVADFGMSRSLYSSYYYRIRGRAMLPIRWMANECFYGRFSEKTDVWAFGVTMWEIFTFVKKQPYAEMSDQEVIDDATSDGNRKLLPSPEHCPEEVYQVMLRCWEHDPNERADFEELYSTLQAIYSYSDIEIQ